MAAETKSHSDELIAVVDDDPELRALIAEFLSDHGYRVVQATNAKDFWTLLAAQPPDLVLLDVMMPNESGLEVAKALDELAQKPRIIMLSALGEDVDRIVGLELGADDYVVKPCNPRELLARIRAQLRRTRSDQTLDTQHEERLYVFDDWQINLARGQLIDPAGVLIELTQGEFSLLRVFVEHPQRVLSRDQLLDLLGAAAKDVFDRSIDSQVSRLRRKLSSRTSIPLIRTVRNEGYMFTSAVHRL